MLATEPILALFAVATGLATHFTDPRDGTAYRTVDIGGASWMAENLRHGLPGSSCYADQPSNCERFGRLYDFQTASRACPAGWRLPSDSDWMRLEIALGSPVEEAMKERARANGISERLKAGGDSGFNAPFAGYYDPHDRAYQHAGRTGAYWTSTLDGSDDVSALAWHRDVDVRRTGIYRSKVNVTYRLSVRCVRG